MNEQKQRRTAVIAGLQAGVILVVSLAVILRVGVFSKGGEQPKEENKETSQDPKYMTETSENDENESDMLAEQEFSKLSESNPESENSAEFSTEALENSSDSEESEPDQTELLLESMTVKEKVYQLFVVFPSQVTGVSPVTKTGDLTRQGLMEYPVGGLIYDKTNMVSREQVTEMLTTVQTYSKIPLILTCDEEGGRVNRLMSTVGTTYIDSMMSYRDLGTEKAAENAKVIAGDMVSCGFNTDLAPVADVWSNPDNKVIGDRAYSDDFAQAAVLVASAVEGFHAGGVACTLKHFPGHGDTSADSHKGAVYVTKTLEELRSSELLPFQAGIDAGAGRNGL